MGLVNGGAGELIT
jgi:hypothetical protein